MPVLSKCLVCGRDVSSVANNECNKHRKQLAYVNKAMEWVGTIKSITTNQGGSEVVVNIASSAGGFDITPATAGIAACP